ncbi:MAG: flagellar hook assembly protein FlgD, partial [Desulfococcaceae bacterium]
MDITPVSPAATGTTETRSSRRNSLGQDDFLNLLITQLRAQDPLNPMDGAEFTAQLAQFNSLEQLMDVNRGIERLEAAVGQGRQLDAANLIGKKARVEGGRLQLTDGEGAVLSFSLSGEAAGVFGAVYDAANRYVATVEGGPTPAGEAQLEWDGTDDAGNPMPPGSYRFEAMAVDAAGNSVP